MIPASATPAEVLDTLKFRFPPTIGRALTGNAAPIVGIFGPVATGKTAAVCVYVYLHCRKYAARHPGQTIRWLMVRDTYESIRQTTLFTWRTWIMSPALGTGLGSWNEQKKTFQLRLPRGQRAEVLFTGLDDEKDKARLLSLDLSGVVIEEPAGGIDMAGRVAAGIGQGVFDMLLTRLRHPIALDQMRMIVVGNPPSTGHWCYRLLKKASETDPNVVCVDVPREEAPILAEKPDYYEVWEARLKHNPEVVRRYYRGEWLPALTGGFTWTMIPEVAALPAFESIVATLDPSTGVKAGDWSVIAVAGIEADGTATVVDLRVARYRAEELVAAIYDVTRRWGLEVFAFEAVAFQVWIEALIRQERDRPASPYRDILVPAKRLERDTRVSKETRIQNALGFRLAEGRLRRSAALDGEAVAEWRMELETFPEGVHDDVLDALADLEQAVMMAPGRLDLWGGNAAAERKLGDDEALALDRARVAEAKAMIEREVVRAGVYWPEGRR